ncbi:hypothetical protein B0T26DRAFT_647888 [Lasiosphaeria miniovina]|uniref:Actin cytoskeleton-regulatory complex protein SLA1 n=1 Tax=Lasiosphaeria miniovina TaxID=1954250 RepID=A0AA40DZB0_9PEZI|nr:uncharacterized protein B0T26DRAFT_647888 [Lasiosphaeria miniovina]KAK0717048.1 hypothetical protein B0T26DRAFT_647888 [Lasiosphaeria miniovina]
MGFLGVYKAVYDYAPQAEGELQIAEGDVLYVIEKSQDDDWWKAKKKATADDEDEPVGLIPSNYIEEVEPQGHARALYEYTRQTDEELSFPEEAKLAVFDTSDPDWILVGHDGDYGFAPANYIELADGKDNQDDDDAGPPIPTPPPLPVRAEVASPPLPARSVPSEPSSPVAPNPAAALAGLMAARSASSSSHPPAPISLPPRQQYVSDESEGDPKSPPLPQRPRGGSQASVEQTYRAVPAPARQSRETHSPQAPQAAASPPLTTPLTPGDFHMYNINEMVSVMGKKKKMPTTLGVNLRTGMILIAPEHAQDGPSQEWSADRMTHYSQEGKHIFMELVRPSKSVDFHAGAKDTAGEIVAMLGELAGAARAEGLREVIMAGTGHTQKKGVVLYDFMAQGEDEVTVGVGDEVIILDDGKSDEWWQVRRVKNGKEGVVPSSYIEVTGAADVPAPPSTAGINAGKSTVEQNRLEEQRLTKEAVKTAQREEQRERSKRGSEVGPGMRLPDRRSSLSARESNSAGQQRSSKRENGRAEASAPSKSSKSKPDASKVRTWTDRSKSFSVDAQFLGLKDGKLNLHKMNGVKIAVPVSKMSLEDLEYVERMTGLSLDEDKPLSDLKRRATAAAAAGESSRSSGTTAVRAGATIEQLKKPEYDWFQFFLTCDVQVGLCERYAQAFSRESMDESVLPDVDASVLRNLGLREGDIIKVTRFLDSKYGRTKKGGAGEDGESAGGLFSGPGGTLRNNTRKGRPAPPVETNNVVDPKAFSSQKDSGANPDGSASPANAAPAPAAAAPPPATKPSSGFDDDAWDVKPVKAQAPEPAPQPAPRAPESAPVVAPTPTPAPAPAPAPVAAPVAATAPAPLTGSMQELSLLTQPLQPEKVQPPAPAPPALNLAPASQPTPSQAPVSAPAQFSQPTGATPGFFTGMQPPTVNGQQFSQMPQAMARQRPMAPQYTQGQGGLMPPPPARPLSAPQSAQPSSFTPPPIQPQMTGYQPQIAPPGQSLNDITQARLQQQYAEQLQRQMQPIQPMQQMMPMMTGMPQQQGFVPNQFMPQPTGMMNGPQQMQSPFADPRSQQFAPIQMQPTGFGGFNQQPQQPQLPQYMTGNPNNFLPQPLEPQRTAMPMQQPQPTGMGMGPGGFAQGFGNAGMQPPLVPPPMQPLVPQRTGPAPPVRFGVTEPKKLAPQPTGRRANLSAATPQNPFGF